MKDTDVYGTIRYIVQACLPGSRVAYSATCEACGGHQDSAHIDKNIGPGEMDVLRGVKQTDQTRDTTNNH
jgi:hypothetical protein